MIFENDLFLSSGRNTLPFERMIGVLCWDTLSYSLVNPNFSTIFFSFPIISAFLRSSSCLCRRSFKFYFNLEIPVFSFLFAQYLCHGWQFWSIAISIGVQELYSSSWTDSLKYLSLFTLSNFSYLSQPSTALLSFLRRSLLHLHSLVVQWIYYWLSFYFSFFDSISPSLCVFWLFIFSITLKSSIFSSSSENSLAIFPSLLPWSYKCSLKSSGFGAKASSMS